MTKEEINQSVTFYLDLCSEFNLLELKIILLVDFLELPRYTNDLLKLENENVKLLIKSIFNEPTVQSTNINPLLENQLTELFTLRDSLFHCNFIEFGSQVVHDFGLIIPPKTSPILVKDLTLTDYQHFPFGNIVHFLFKVKALHKVLNNCRTAIKNVEILISNLPQNVHYKTIVQNYPFFYDSHKEITKLLNEFEFVLRCLAQNHGVPIFEIKHFRFQAVQLERVRADLMKKNVPYLASIKRDLIKIVEFRNSLVHVNIARFLKSHKLFSTKSYRGNVRVMSSDRLLNLVRDFVQKGTPFDLSNEGQSLSDLDTSDVSSLKSSPVFGLLLETYNSELASDFSQLLESILNIIEMSFVVNSL